MPEVAAVEDAGSAEAAGESGVGALADPESAGVAMGTGSASAEGARFSAHPARSVAVATTTAAVAVAGTVAVAGRAM